MVKPAAAEFHADTDRNATGSMSGEHTVQALWVRAVEAGPLERPEGRSGIWGRVLEGGRVQCGDPSAHAEGPRP